MCGMSEICANITALTHMRTWKKQELDLFIHQRFITLSEGYHISFEHSSVESEKGLLTKSNKKQSNQHRSRLDIKEHKKREHLSAQMFLMSSSPPRSFLGPCLLAKEE